VFFFFFFSHKLINLQLHAAFAGTCFFPLFFCRSSGPISAADLASSNGIRIHAHKPALTCNTNLLEVLTAKTQVACKTSQLFSKLMQICTNRCIRTTDKAITLATWQLNAHVLLQGLQLCYTYVCDSLVICLAGTLCCCLCRAH